MELLVTPQVKLALAALRTGDKAKPARAKKVAKAFALLAANPRHPSLHSHRFESLDDEFGEAVWESYVENRSPSAWRMWWFFGPLDGQITIVDLGPHP